MSTKTEPIPGISDIYPADIPEWRFVENAARQTFSRYGYHEIRPPILERTDVFSRSIGDDTDIVQKEMYTFKDRGGRSLTLRPEGTAGVLRALANEGIPEGDERRVFYIGPMFRGERPAAGRKRQFHQIGVECVGKTAPAIDAECIAMGMDYLNTIGIESTTLLLNSRGTLKDRRQISTVLTHYFQDHIDSMCADCQRRLITNVWRILDCKNDQCRPVVDDSPAITDQLDSDSRGYFDSVCTILDNLGIQYKLDPRLVRGLDYYVHTVFEITSTGAGAQNAIVGGGRYNVQLPGQKRSIDGVGFALGVERLLMCRSGAGQRSEPDAAADIYIVSHGQRAMNENLILAAELRKNDFSVLMDLEGRGMKAQMRNANKCNVTFALIRGDDELDKGLVVCKHMTDANQIEIPVAELAGKLKQLLADE